MTNKAKIPLDELHKFLLNTQFLGLVSVNFVPKEAKYRIKYIDCGNVSKEEWIETNLDLINRFKTLTKREKLNEAV